MLAAWTVHQREAALRDATAAGQRLTVGGLDDRLYQDLREALSDPAVRSRFVEQGAEPVAPGPDELRSFIASEASKWKGIIQRAGIEPM